ncbi:sensor domain-containing protein [Thermus oshimai]
MEALLGGWYLEAPLALLEKGAEGLGEALARLGEGLGVDRAYLFRLEAQEDGWYATQLAEWAREGITPQLENPILKRFPMAQGYGRWVERFLEGKPIQGAVRTFPEEERPLLEAQDIQALLAVPVFLERRLWGFLGVDACREVRAFREDEVELLKGLARVLALSLNLLERVRRLEGLLEKTPLYVLRFSPEGALLYANPAARGLPLALPLEAALETPGEAVRVHALGAEWTLLAVPGPGGEVLEVLALGLDMREKDEAQRREALWQAFRTNLLRVYETLMAEGLSESVYGLILEAAMATIPNAQAGSVTVLKEDGYYHFVAAKGYDLKALRRVRLSPEEPLSLTGHREAQVFTQQDLARFNARLDPTRRQVMEEAGRVREIRAILSVPVFLSGERKAFLYLDNFEREEAFSPLEVELAQAFASQLGLLLRRLELEGRVQHLAYHDPLTGLPNRLFFLEKLAQVRKGAVLYLDLDGFKLVNDLSGHSAGDQALMALAARLQGAVRPRDLVARQGGDEFLVLLTDLRGPEEAVAVAERLLEVVRLPLPVGGRIYHLSVSIGIALVEEALGPGEVLKRADLALYRAKAEGKDRIAFYEEGLQAGKAAGGV